VKSIIFTFNSGFLARMYDECNPALEVGSMIAPLYGREEKLTIF